jgi:hypothetical protein
MQDSETRFTSTSRVKAFRRRRAIGLHRRPIDVTKAQLDQLECAAISTPIAVAIAPMNAVENFLTESLTKSG